MKNWKDNIYFVLVEPREPGNIGAAARAMKNMGFKNLCLVNPPSLITDEARWLAHNSLDILDSAQIFPDIKEAVSGKSIVVGTSRRTGKKRGMCFQPDKGSERIFEIAASNKIAILFGREDRGLFNNEVEECGYLITIPANRKHPSLNLAQAVMIIAYELFIAEFRSSAKDKKVIKQMPKLADHKELSHLYERWEEALSLLDYSVRGDRDLRKKIMLNLKHCFGRAGLTEHELKMFQGIISRIKEKIVKE